MTGPEHFRKAERLLTLAYEHSTEDPREQRLATMAAATAQVHATLALAAATAYPAIVAYTGDETSDECRGWAQVTS